MVGEVRYPRLGLRLRMMCFGEVRTVEFEIEVRADWGLGPGAFGLGRAYVLRKP